MKIIEKLHGNLFKAQCDCGNIWEVKGKYITHSKRNNRKPICKTCQSSRRSGISKEQFDFSKYFLKKYGKLTITSTYFDDERKSKQRMFVCICECGNQYITAKDNIINGGVISCGCYRNYKAILLGKNSLIHGHTTENNELKKSKTYKNWDKIRILCSRGWKREFHKVCHEYDARWENFEEFLKDFGNLKSNQTISRLDNQLPWSKENCFIREVYK